MSSVISSSSLPSALATRTSLCNWARKCCSWRRNTSDAVFTSVLKRRRVERLRILLVAAHRPRADQRRFRSAVLDHGDGPAFVVFILDDARRPAVIAPQTRFVLGFGQRFFGVSSEVAWNSDAPSVGSRQRCRTMEGGNWSLQVRSGSRAETATQACDSTRPGSPGSALCRTDKPGSASSSIEILFRYSPELIIR